MKKIFLILLALILTSALAACTRTESGTEEKIDNNAESVSEQNSESNNTDNKIASTDCEQIDADNENTDGDENMRVKITVGNHELYAELEDNATTRVLVEQMPFTIQMSDLYGREMCYRYGADAFPTDTLRSDGYEIGDIAYWQPRGSLVILYAQNGEPFERQQIGHIESGVEVFESSGDTDVTFEVVK